MQLTKYYARREREPGRSKRTVTVLYRDPRMWSVDEVARFSNHDNGGPRVGTKTTLLNCAKVALEWPGHTGGGYRWGTSPFCGPGCRADAISDDKHGLFWRVATSFGSYVLSRREEAAVTGRCIYCHDDLPRGRRDRIRALYPKGLDRSDRVPNMYMTWEQVDGILAGPQGDGTEHTEANAGHDNPSRGDD